DQEDVVLVVGGDEPGYADGRGRVGERAVEVDLGLESGGPVGRVVEQDLGDGGAGFAVARQ
ncbi:hypothetical protein, partial [Streptomyces alkaliterrae]|uniref:hypothetical protein n=1 Tax=Streptomyces alkaliterrae TaxID=2213162 RepID=UPI001E5FB5D7